MIATVHRSPWHLAFHFRARRVWHLDLDLKCQAARRSHRNETMTDCYFSIIVCKGDIFPHLLAPFWPIWEDQLQARSTAILYSKKSMYDRLPYLRNFSSHKPQSREGVPCAISRWRRNQSLRLVRKNAVFSCIMGGAESQLEGNLERRKGTLAWPRPRA